MKRLSKFKLIGRLIKNRSNIAAKALADTISESQKKQKKLDDLYKIASEYKQQISQQGLAISATNFRQFQNFIAYLDYLISQQEDVVSVYKKDIAKKRAIWIQAYKQHKGLTSYITTVEDQILVEKLRKDQKLLDEMVNDNFATKQNQ